MKLQGNVKGSVYPVTQQAYDEPIDGMRKCGYCGHKFAPKGREWFCSDSCRMESRRQSWMRYNARKADARRRRASR